MAAGEFDTPRQASVGSVWSLNENRLIPRAAESLPYSFKDVLGQAWRTTLRTESSTHRQYAEQYAVKMLGLEEKLQAATGHPFTETRRESILVGQSLQPETWKEHFESIDRSKEEWKDYPTYEDFVYQQARYIEREEEALERKVQYASTDMAWLANLLGASGSIVADPAVLASMGVPVTGKTVAARIAQQALVSGAIETPLAWDVKFFRESLGGDYADEKVASRILGATAGAGILQGAGEAVKGLSRSVSQVVETAKRKHVAPTQSAQARATIDERQVVAESHTPGPRQEPEPEPAPKRAVKVNQTREDVAITETDGSEIDVRYELVEMKDLLTSQDEGFQGFQPRHRNQTESKDQIRNMGRNLQPHRLGYNSSTDRGAPIIALGHNSVESGNGRVLALRSAPKAKKAEYVQYLKDQGYDVEDMEFPVLVRRRQTEMTAAQLERYINAANLDSKASLNAAERGAMVELDDQTLFKYKGGDLKKKANAEFVSSFFARVDGPIESYFINNKLTRDGYELVHKGLFNAGYGHSPIGLELMNNLTTVSGQGVASAQGLLQRLIDVVPQVADIKFHVRPEKMAEWEDMTDKMLVAADQLRQARAKRMDTEELLKQSGMGLDKETKEFIRALDIESRADSEAAMKQLIKKHEAELAPDEGDMFYTPPPPEPKPKESGTPDAEEMTIDQRLVHAENEAAVARFAEGQGPMPEQAQLRQANPDFFNKQTPDIKPEKAEPVSVRRTPDPEPVEGQIKADDIPTQTVMDELNTIADDPKFGKLAKQILKDTDSDVRKANAMKTCKT